MPHVHKHSVHSPKLIKASLKTQHLHTKQSSTSHARPQNRSQKKKEEEAAYLQWKLSVKRSAAPFAPRSITPFVCEFGARFHRVRSGNARLRMKMRGFHSRFRINSIEPLFRVRAKSDSAAEKMCAHGAINSSTFALPCFAAAALKVKVFVCAGENELQRTQPAAH
jgi:hypothetical protein